jgi:hypothetical protein
MGKYWGKYADREKGKESFDGDMLAGGARALGVFEGKWAELTARDVVREME